ncbi:MAG: MaoC family dehydratase [Thalassovita sp.]
MNETPKVISRTEFEALLGQSLGTSDWMEITQEQINAFADCTHDHQYIHTDPERAADSPFGTTIAHGFLTLSLLTALAAKVPDVEGTAMTVNYGFDKVRFVSPVKVGARIRGHFTLTQVEETRSGEMQSAMTIQVEIEGQDRPALIAEWIVRRYFEAK